MGSSKGIIEKKEQHKNPEVTMYITDNGMLRFEWEDQRTYMELTLDQAVFMHGKMEEAIKELSHEIQKQN